MRWHNYTAESSCFTWSSRGCLEACCCVLILRSAVQFLLLSWRKVFSGCYKFLAARTRYFSWAVAKFFRCVSVFLTGLLQSVFRTTAKFQFVCVCFSGCYNLISRCWADTNFFSGYLKLLVCVCVLFLSWTVAKLFVVWACSLPGCYKTFLSGYCKVSVSLRVCTFFSGCYKVSRSHYECAIFSGCWMQSFSCRVCVLFSDCW